MSPEARHRTSHVNTAGRQYMTVTETEPENEAGLQYYNPCCVNDLATRDGTCDPRHGFSNENRNEVEIFY
jgi:hypothetical protein